MQRIKDEFPLTPALRGRVSRRHRRLPGRLFHFSALAGALAALAAAAAPAQAGPFVYVPNNGSSTVSQYDIGAGGVLTPKSPASVASGSNPVGVAVSPDGASVYVTNVNGFNVSQYNVTPTGTLTPKSPATVPTGNNPHGIVVSPDGTSVYIVNNGSGSVSQFTVGAGGTLTPKSPATVTTGGVFPEGIAISPNGSSVYAANQNSDNVAQYSVGAGGVLTPKSPATVATGAGPTGVAVSPNSSSVYVTNNFSTPATVSQYDAVAGGLLFPKSPATVATGGVSPRGVAVSPDGASVYTANYNGNSISQFDASGSGALTPKSPATVPAGTGPYDLAITPYGDSVYLANIASNNVSQYNVGAGGVLTPKSPATVAAGTGSADVAINFSQPTPYPVPGSATEVKGSLVQVFRQCGTGANPVNAKHAPTLALGACNPPVPVSPNARVGSGGSGSVTMTVVPGDYQITVRDSDIRTPSGSDYDPNGGTSFDVTALAKLRVTDTRNCTPSSCIGPYTQAATTTDFDFSVPVDCLPYGDPTKPPGSDCNIATSVNSTISGTLVAGTLASITVFRLRINDHTGTLFQQQGSLIP